ncbi:MAG: class I SAM-dependent methyltransferase [Desulfovibrio sp.]|nr:MAG: class I SAM-dependent methyltransferase [Desulfovibrio sp.]
MESQKTHLKKPRPGHKRRFTEGKLDNDLILKELNLVPGQIVVDAGCGSGYMAKLFSQQVGESGKVFALDLNAEHLEQLSKETAGTNITAMICDISRTTLMESGSVDLVYMSTVIHSFSKWKVQGLVQELQRILRPGGSLAVVEIDKRETPFGPPLKQRYSPRELQKALPFVPLNTVFVAEYFYLQVFEVHPA